MMVNITINGADDPQIQALEISKLPNTNGEVSNNYFLEHDEELK